MIDSTIKKIILLEYGLLFLLSISAAFFTFFFQLKYRRKAFKAKTLKVILSQLISQRVFGEGLLIPNKIRDFESVIKILQEFDQMFSDSFWTSFKRWIIYDVFYEDFVSHINSRKWDMQILAIRALNMSFDPVYENYAFKFLKSETILLQLAIVNYAVNIKNSELIYACIKYMSKISPSTIELFFRDSFFTSSNQTFQLLLNIYKRAEENERIICLKILSERTGFLTFNLLKNDLSSSNFPLKWWAFNALKNIPTPESLDFLEKNLDDPNWQIRFTSFLAIFNTKVEKRASILEKGLLDSHFAVRLISGWGLKKLGEVGKSILINQKQQEAKMIGQYMLLSNYLTFDKLMERYVKSNL